LIAYADEAGTHRGSIYTVVAGWVGHAHRWKQFDGKWMALLARDGVTHIHSVDVKHGKGPFRDRAVWPEFRRAALAQEAGQLALDHALFSHTVLLKNSDFETYYIGADRGQRKRRNPSDSKYGVCVRIFLSQLAEFVSRYGGDDALARVVFEEGASNQGAAQDMLNDMYRIAPDRARFIDPRIEFAKKKETPGVQAADLLAYPAYVLEREGRAEVLNLDEGFPDSLPARGVESFRSPITPKILTGLKQGQGALRPLRRLLGRDWGHLHEFPVGWTTVRLRSADGFLLMPPNPEPPLPIGASDRETPAPAHSVRLRCL
jgi:Protein of unknown function (DUF3800)